MRGKVINGQVIVNNDNIGRDGRDGRDFPIFNLKMGKPHIIINKEKTLTTLPTLPALPQKQNISLGPNLDEWRRVNIPAWRCILKESIETGDQRRADYAKWMLKEVLEVEANK
ncbi:MAG: hypothetical protein PHU23_04590 [Dehalococcoidales bacterium]|nr:hypothetical protein [Dehalococcoidales bacterium]